MADTNFLNFTGLTFSDIVQQFNAKLNSDPRFENLRESAIAKTLVEIFAAGTDITNYYLERRAEETYLDSAKLKSSVILLSRMIGYVPVRPVPAKTSIKMVINGPLPTGLTTSDQVVLSAGTAFDYNGTPFRLNKTYIYTFSTSDIAQGQDPDFTKEIEFAIDLNSSNLDIVSNPAVSAIDAGYVKSIDLIQGEILSNTILGSDNQLVGQFFQRYKIDDITISNFYGQEDFGYNHEDDSFDFDSNLTRITVGTREFRIDRRSLFNSKTLFNFNLTSATENICILRSSIDEGMEIIFGDDKFAAVGARTQSDDIVINYFSTLGSEANRVGVIGDEIRTNSQFVSNTILLNPNLSFVLTKNMIGGADFESIDSIRHNAPGIFYSLDRLVTSTDYVSYLKTLTSPIRVKNAIAWGEQEEGAPIKKLFNVVLFSILGELYKKEASTGTWSPKAISGDSASLDSALLEGTETLETNYINLLIKESVTDELKLYTTATPGYENIVNVVDKLKVRSQATIRNVYVKPIIQDFNLPLIVYAKKLADLNSTKILIKNKVYEYLNDNADFDKPVYKSNIIELIESFPQVSHVDFHIEPDQTNINDFFEMIDNFGFINATSAADLNNWVSSHPTYDLDDLATIYTDAVNQFLETSAFNLSAVVGEFSVQTSKYLFEGLTSNGTLVKYDQMFRLTNITERTFYNNLIRDLYNHLKEYELDTLGISETDVANRFTESDNFLNTVAKLHNNFSFIIKHNMLDNQNISHFSIRNEIARLSLENISVVYV